MHPTHQPTRLQKSLAGINCCFCEEPLNHTITDTGVPEKAVALECSHTAHYDCMVSMTHDLDIGDLPECSSCGEPAKPLDKSLKSEILRMARISPTTPALDSLEYSPFLESYFPANGLCSPWSPLLTRPPLKPFHSSPPQFTNRPSTISRTSTTSSSHASTRSHISHSSMSSIDSLDYRMDGSSLPFHNIQEACPALPNTILNIRLMNRTLPSLKLTPELDSLTVSKDSQNNTNTLPLAIAVSVSMPPEEETVSVSATAEERKLAAETLQTSILDWRLLDFTQFGALRLADNFHISRTKGGVWQQLDCYLFENMLVFVKTYPNKPPVLKGSVAVNKHLLSLSVSSRGNKGFKLTLNLSTENLPALYMKATSPIVMENWYSALLDKALAFPANRLQSPALNLAPPQLVSTRLPVDFVVLVPLSGSPHGSKFLSIRATLFALLRQMEFFDRIALVPYGGGSQQHVYNLANSSWAMWEKIVNGLQPTARAGNKTDLLCGITTAFSLLADRKTHNPVSSVFIINDSATEISDNSLDVIAARSSVAQGDIPVNAFGVGNHKSDMLHSIASRSGGSYYYVNKWPSLIETALGQFRALQKRQQRETVKVELEGGAGVVLTSHLGNNSKPGAKYMTIPESPPLTPQGSMEDKSGSLLSVDMGDIISNETKTFLVKAMVTVYKTESNTLDVLTAKLGTATSTLSVPCAYEPKVTQPLNIRSPVGGSFDKPFSLEPEPNLEPSLIYGQLLDLPAAKYNSIVSYRRVCLIALHLIESIVKADLGTVSTSRIAKSIESSRVIMNRLRGSSKKDDAFDLLNGLVNALDGVLAQTLQELGNSAIVFQEDYMRYLTQCLGTLKTERGLVGRSRLEGVFSQSLRDDMKSF